MMSTVSALHTARQVQASSTAAPAPRCQQGSDRGDVWVVGLSLRQAPLSLLEGASVPAAQLLGVLREVVEVSGADEAMVLSTCNRTALYAVTQEGLDPSAALCRLLARRAGLSASTVRRHGFVFREAAAVQHLFDVAAGLDSLVLGDEQIVGQVRDAYRTAIGAGTVGPVLHGLTQRVLAAGKAVRSSTTLTATGRSVVAEALGHAAGRLPGGTLAGRRAVVVGAGAMGALAVAHLLRAGVDDLVVVNRTASRADSLALSSGATAVRARPASELLDLAVEADVVVACASVPAALVSVRDMAETLARRPSGRAPLVLCDLGVPPERPGPGRGAAGAQHDGPRDSADCDCARSGRVHGREARRMVGAHVDSYWARRRTGAGSYVKKAAS